MAKAGSLKAPYLEKLWPARVVLWLQGRGRHPEFSCVVDNGMGDMGEKAGGAVPLLLTLPNKWAETWLGLVCARMLWGERGVWFSREMTHRY